MYTLTLDEKTLNDLLSLISLEVVESGRTMKRWRVFRNSNQHNADSARFWRMIALLADLRAINAADARLPAAVPRNLFSDSQEMQNDMLTRAEGIDPDKELGAYDPRALAPVCVHNRKFSEPCEYCTADRPMRSV